MTITEIILILGIHWIADFVLQTDEMAKGKSKDFKILLTHTITYSAVFLIIGSLFKVTGLITPEPGILTHFVIVTLIAHTAQDYFTSRLNSKLYNDGRTHGFFVSIGFDQLLHFTQLLITYNILFK